MTKRRLPIGTQTFRKIREQNCYCVDKTPFVKALVDDGSHYFLSRPRRFGKSLFLDTRTAAATAAWTWPCDSGVWSGLEGRRTASRAGRRRFGGPVAEAVPPRGRSGQLRVRGIGVEDIETESEGSER